MARTTLDQKIAKLEAELKEAKASKSKEARQERNNQLMAFGIMLEAKYKAALETDRKKMRGWIEGLDERNKSRVLAGFDRLDTLHPPKSGLEQVRESDGYAALESRRRTLERHEEFNSLGFRNEK